MTSTLFAYKLAKPIEIEKVNIVKFDYDPEAQVAVWNGSSQVTANMTCTAFNNGWEFCNAYGNYCSTWGSTARRPAYLCDDF